LKLLFTNSNYNFFHNASIGVVSNSDSLLKSNYGKSIDSNDIVIRFNEFNKNIKSNDINIHIGSKLDVYCHFYCNTPPIFDISNLKHWFVSSVEIQNDVSKYIPYKIPSTILLNKKMRSGFETTGLTMIRWIVNNISFKELNLYGFASGYNSHYYNTSDQMLPWHNMKYEKNAIKEIISTNVKIKLFK
jgi:hypothetical protein